ncbi:MAG: group II truncated hemoglobin [Gammaproteobacteria bacterium]|nr:group II truncated hemoglobin [Gammaproteobacteria bacterium]
MQETLYDKLGGDEGIRRIVDAFYDVMDEEPDVTTIRRLHPDDLAESREKLYLFLSGWAGGPALYNEKHGHPRLRYRHLPFSIGNEEAAQWLYCMDAALKRCGVNPETGDWMMRSLTMTAMHMRNREE